MNKKTFIILIILLIIISITLINILRILSTKSININNEYFKKYIEYAVENSLKINGVKLHNYQLLNMKGQKLTVSKVIGKSEKLVFRYTSLDCQICVDSEIDRLKYLGEKIGKDKIIIITSYVDIKNFYNFYKINKLYNYNIYFIPIDFKLFPGESNTPYVFILDTNRVVKYSFFPDKAFPEYTVIFYRILCRYFSY